MSKNVTVNGVSYTGVSKIQLETTGGGTALFRDVDEITTPSGTVNITTNGTHNVSNYASAVVNVAGGGSGIPAPVRATYEIVTVPSNTATTAPDALAVLGLTGMQAAYLLDEPTENNQFVTVERGYSGYRYRDGAISFISGANSTYAGVVLEGTRYMVFTFA